MTRWRFSDYLKCLLLTGVFLVATACATPQKSGLREDPFESTNRVFFNANETTDKYLFKPLATGYVRITPVPVRAGISNFFDNLAYLNVIVNTLLQGKFAQAVNDSLRFVFNSSLGIGGVFDVASGMSLPKNDEDFGQTLAVWGVDHNFYLYLPVLGPNTARGLTNFVPSTLLNPFVYVSSVVLFPISALSMINTRANLLEASDMRDKMAIDPYLFTREAYLQKRESLIHDGNPPVTGYDDIFDYADDEEAGVLMIE